MFTNRRALQTVNRHVTLFSRGLKVRVTLPGTDRQPRRPGAIALKCGMMPYFDDHGVRHAVTVLQLENCQVLGLKHYPQKVNPNVEYHEDGYAVILGSGLAKLQKTPPTVLSVVQKYNLAPKRHLREFRICPKAYNALKEMEGKGELIGKRIIASHFVPGQYVDVQGTTIGKGFQGVMKRWGFKGMPASHGTSKAHRKGGSTGSTGYGRVLPGKKMPGRMGFDTKTEQNMRVFKTDPARGLIYVRGHVPGKKGTIVKVSDAIKKIHNYANGAQHEEVVENFDNYKLSIQRTLSTVLPFPAKFEEENEQFEIVELSKPGDNPIAMLH